MRLPFGWIQEFVRVDITPEELCDHLIMLGFGDAQVVPDEWGVLESFIVGRAKKVTPHPSDPHLKIVEVNVGYADLASVCGAPNVVEGNLYAVALPGAKLGTGRAVDTAEIMGVVSQCILCSGKEAWIDDSKDELLGIEDEIAPGTDLVDALGLGDPVIEMEVTPNRGDCLGLIGVARELAAIFGKDLLIPEPGLNENGPGVRDLVTVEVADPDGCPRYGALVCEGVIVRGSPARTRARLRLAGMRPINNIVDATNLVLFETGHPLHAFDLDKLAGPAIVVRRAREGEKMVALDGVEYGLHDNDLVIADRDKPVALAGVIGGRDTEVSPSTKRILIEGAFFDHCSVWRTAKRHGISTEASYRFERSVDIGAVLYVLARTGAIIQQDTKCSVAQGMIDVYPRPVRPTRVFASPKRINRLLGTSIPEQEICDYLERLGFMVSPGKELEVVVPTRRNDVTSEADIAEEVARLFGYDRIGDRATGACQTYATVPGYMRRMRDLKRALKGMGLYETVTESMIGPAELDAFNLTSRASIGILNPVGIQTSFLRPSLIPGMAKTLLDNEFKGQEGLSLYEVGKVYLRDHADGEPTEHYGIAFGLSGVRQPRSWYAKPSEYDLYDLKGLIEAMGELLGVALDFRDGELGILHPGRRMKVVMGAGGAARDLGHFGEVLPSICEALGSKRRLYVGELDFGKLLEGAPGPVRCREVPKYPGVKRDLAITVPEAIRESRVRDVILAEGGALIESLEVFDLYRGEQIPKGTKSLAYGILFRSDSRTLVEEEVDSLQQHMEERLSKELGAKIRAK
jgi:phenylalanyl-tRNA synthetase beta chain